MGSHGGGRQGGPHHGDSPSPGLCLVMRSQGWGDPGPGCLQRLLSGKGWGVATTHRAKIHRGLRSASLG